MTPPIAYQIDRLHLLLRDDLGRGGLRFNTLGRSLLLKHRTLLPGGRGLLLLLVIRRVRQAHQDECRKTS